ncbi:hypothetical protein ZIOFF_016177 [Zingiber officinale]|uniref:DUF952 domain-containing protein n=1 Tax=Zingiber officinale TaxID=94328 RepID=A0A8J5HJZ3_ZINOF|nr:hypothetical protein ZIOFF_016177 [Zingiber officinale]
MEKRIPNEGFVYRVSVPDEWEELQRTGATLGGDIDRTTGCIHFSDLDQVKMVLNNFFRGQENLYLLQIDATKDDQVPLEMLCLKDPLVTSILGLVDYTTLTVAVIW